ncbi:hypothetical protein [Fictibacillus barbaricus]|uniref:Uncharacterized protein n=1 Tax=Fictibacillus barbaricus TaxID=182136 RepID=A0ABU1U1W6_9BACL|nr:hypothetical protein [Fictibacillus barbaricus]MDR7073437.1 hypothetical protein [Fictibacillus barbaricus]
MILYRAIFIGIFVGMVYYMASYYVPETKVRTLIIIIINFISFLIGDFLGKKIFREPN